MNSTRHTRRWLMGLISRDRSKDVARGAEQRAIGTRSAAETPPKLRRSLLLRTAFWTAVGASLVLRLSFFNFRSIDYRDYLSPWYDFLVEHGRWRGLGQATADIANYPPLYLSLLAVSTMLPLPKLYAIKLLSVACDYLAAWYVWRVMRSLETGRVESVLDSNSSRHDRSTTNLGPLFSLRPAVAVIGFLFLPTVAINGALWGQCDIMYTTGFLASLLYLLERRPAAALVAFGVSCALKPQAVFWCPFLLGLLLSGRLPWKWLWIPPVVYLALGLPSVLAGRPLADVLTHWANAKNVPGLTLHAPNWYQWVSATESKGLWATGIALTLVFVVVFVWWMKRGPASGHTEAQWRLLGAVLSVALPPFLLPGMHERYFFAADVLSLLYAVAVPRAWPAAALIQFASLAAYCPFLFGKQPVPEYALPFAIVLAVEWLIVLQRRMPGCAAPRRAGVSASPSL